MHSETKTMAERRVEDILFDESFKNLKFEKIKIKSGINQEDYMYSRIIKISIVYLHFPFPFQFPVVTK